MAEKKDKKTERRQKIVEEVWEKAFRLFNYPALNRPEVVDSMEGQNSAKFDWEERRASISNVFIDNLENTGMSERDVIEASISHETGHYIHFPHDLWKALYFRSRADEWFGGRNSDSIYAFTSDLFDEGELLATGNGGESLFRLRLAIAEMARKADRGSAIINRLMAAKYAHSVEGFEMPELDEEEKGYFDQAKDIQFIGLPFQEETASFYRFGKVLELIIKNNPGPDNECFHLCEGDDIINAPDAEIDRALSGVLHNAGPRAYNKAKKYVVKIRPDFRDSFDSKTRSRQAGRGGGSFKRNDELIPLYKRWAARFGIYIVKRPVKTDKTAHFRSGSKEYEIGDPLHKTDIFGSKGFIGIPGISRVYTEDEGTVPSTEFSVPDLNLGIDSSGSMDDPASKHGAPQVVTAFILGKNYHKNGAHVGGWNFSEDIEFLQPSRDIEEFYSLMAARFGGGTHLKIDELKRFVAEMDLEFGPGLGSGWFDRLLEGMTSEQRRKYIEKNLNVDTSRILKGKYEKIDNVLITDGDIANSREVLEYISSIGTVTRNFVFITDKQSYDDWRQIRMPNTWIYPAITPKDLIGLALGRSRALITDALTNYAGGSQ